MGMCRDRQATYLPPKKDAPARTSFCGCDLSPRNTGVHIPTERTRHTAYSRHYTCTDANGQHIQILSTQRISRLKGWHVWYGRAVLVNVKTGDILTDIYTVQTHDTWRHSRPTPDYRAKKKGTPPVKEGEFLRERKATFSVHEERSAALLETPTCSRREFQPPYLPLCVPMIGRRGVTAAHAIFAARAKQAKFFFKPVGRWRYVTLAKG